MKKRIIYSFHYLKVWSIAILKFSLILGLIALPILGFGLIIWEFLKELFSYYSEIKIFVDSPTTFISKQDPFQGTLILIFIGLIFYLLKKFQQFWYGTFELLFASIYCFIQYSNIQEQAHNGTFQFSIVLTTLSTIYLTIRGINNIDDGFKKNFLAKKFFLIILDMDIEPKANKDELSNQVDGGVSESERI